MRKLTTINGATGYWIPPRKYELPAEKRLNSIRPFELAQRNIILWICQWRKAGYPCEFKIRFKRICGDTVILWYLTFTALSDTCHLSLQVHLSLHQQLLQNTAGPQHVSDVRSHLWPLWPATRRPPKLQTSLGCRGQGCFWNASHLESENNQMNPTTSVLS